MWLMISSLSPHSLHLLFSCVLSILVLIWLVLMALFCAAIGRDSVSLLKFLFLSHVQVLFLWEFFIPGLQVGFHWGWSDSMSTQVSRNLLRILADLNSAIVWVVSARILIPNSFSTSTNPLVTVLSAPITIGIAVTFMFQRFFQFPSKVLVLISLLDFLHFYSVIYRDVLLLLLLLLLLLFILWEFLSSYFVRSQEIFYVFLHMLIVLSFARSPNVFLFPILLVPLPILWWLYRACQLQLVSLSLSCSIVFSVP